MALIADGHFEVSLREASNILRRGEVIAIPTETVYGLAANALDTAAVSRIFAIKERPFFDPLIVHIRGIEEVDKYTAEFPPAAKKLAETFWPGPLTLILRKNEIIPDLVTSGLPFVGLRVPSHPVTHNLLHMLDFPLAAPSANPFGYVSPTSAEHVEARLGQRISFILDGGPCKVGLESTIVMVENGKEPEILRLGGLSTGSIEQCTGPVKMNISSHAKPNSPGKLDKHYATLTPLVMYEEKMRSTLVPEKTGALVFQHPFPFLPSDQQEILSASGSTEEAAKNLFAAMRRLDASQYNLILTEKFPSEGLGPAINDRLKRAGIKIED